MVWVIILAIAIVITASVLAYYFGKNDGIEIAFGEMDRIMATIVALMEEEQQEKEKFENIFEEFK